MNFPVDCGHCYDSYSRTFLYVLKYEDRFVVCFFSDKVYAVESTMIPLPPWPLFFPWWGFITGWRKSLEEDDGLTDIFAGTTGLMDGTEELEIVTFVEESSEGRAVEGGKDWWTVDLMDGTKVLEIVTFVEGSPDGHAVVGEKDWWTTGLLDGKKELEIVPFVEGSSDGLIVGKKDWRTEGGKVVGTKE